MKEYSYTSTPPMGRTACTEPQCLYKDALYLFFFFTYLLTPWSRVLLEKLTGLQLVKKFPSFYGTRRFITALTTARHLSVDLLACCVMPPLETFPAGDPSGGVIFVSRGSVLHMCFVTKVFFLRRGVVSTSPNPQAGGPPCVGCP